jgi:hypothetical protein
MTLEPDEELLRTAAESAGGQVGPSPEALWDPGREQIEHHEELWPRFLFAALVLFLFDLLFRRIRLFDREFRAPRAIRHAPTPAADRS